MHLHERLLISFAGEILCIHVNKKKNNKIKKQKQKLSHGSIFWMIESDCPHGFLRGRTVGWKKKMGWCMMNHQHVPFSY